MLKVGKTVKLRIEPTDDAGLPAKIRGGSIAWSITGAYSLVIDPKGRKATAIATVPGTDQSVTVTAKSRDGSDLTATWPLPDVVAEEPDPDDRDATRLNLAQG